jgi:hypothetical protein
MMVDRRKYIEDLAREIFIRDVLDLPDPQNKRAVGADNYARSAAKAAINKAATFMEVLIQEGFYK